MVEAVICIATEERANQIFISLQEAGFCTNDISILMPNKMPNKNASSDFGKEKHIKISDNMPSGSSTGAIVGGTFGWLMGIGFLAVPGLGHFIAAGPIVTTLSGAAIGGVLGGIASGLLGLGLPEYEIKQYEGKLREGNILLSVHAATAEQATRADKLFKLFGAQNVLRAKCFAC